jgi:hypothetical protein
MSRRTAPSELTLEQQAESDRILAALRQAAETDLRDLADLLATRDDATMFGATEFAVRDVVLRVGAKAIEAALEGRKKGATTAAPEPAPVAARPPSSNAGSRNPS